MCRDYDSFNDLRYCREPEGTFVPLRRRAARHRDTAAAIIDVRAKFAYERCVRSLYIFIMHAMKLRKEKFLNIYV